jgi:sensor c-di-GMP phosphodiesterase-like protein
MIKNKRALTIASTVSILVAILVFSLAIFFSYSETKKHSISVISQIAQTSAARVDFIIDELREVIDSVNKMGVSSSCTKLEQEKLQKATFSEPLISAIFIGNEKGKPYCSNIRMTEEMKQFSLEQTVQLTFQGPLKPSYTKKDIYLLTKKFNHYSIAVAIIPNIIATPLEVELPKNGFIGLFNIKEKKLFLQQGNNTKLTSNAIAKLKNDHFTIDAHFNDNIPRLVYGVPLTILDNNYVLIAVPTKWLWHKSFINTLIISSLGLVIALLIGIAIYQAARRQLSLKKALERAFKTNEFKLYYQPLIDSDTNIITGVEVLLRWQPEQGELMMPDSFIHTVENSGLIIPLTRWIIEHAIAECAPFLRTNPEFHLGINLTATHFTDDSILKVTLKSCKKHNILPSQIMFELTERDLIDDKKDIIDVMQKMRGNGISIAIDDFGTGYSSFGYLRHFPFTHLKIDKIFTSAIGTGAITESINHSIIDLARNLNYKMIAEGVETKQQVDYLKQQNVELLQGWYYAKAMPILELKKFIDNLQGACNEN